MLFTHCDNCSLHHQATPNETAPSPTTGVSTSVQVGFHLALEYI